MWQNMKNGFRRFMQGRYGGDNLSRAQLMAGLVCYLLALISRVTLFSYIGLALYFWALFRMFSRTWKSVEKKTANTWPSPATPKPASARRRCGRRTASSINTSAAPSAIPI